MTHHQRSASAAPMSAATRPIAYLVSQYPATSHTFISREVRELRRRGLQIETFSVRRPSNAEIASEAARVDAETTAYILPLSLPRLLGAHTRGLLSAPLRYARALRLAFSHRQPGIKALLWSLFYFVEAIVLADLLRRRGVRHIHNHFANAAANVGIVAAEYLALPWSVTLHGISEFDYPAGLLLPDKIARARFVACVSHFGRAQAMRLTPGSQWPNMHIVRCGLDLDSLPPPVHARSGEGALRIICVGRLSPEKGHLGLLQAFAGLLEAHPGLRLVLVGDGPSLMDIRAAIAERGLGDHVELMGRLDEQRTLVEIARSDILVLPSFMEGLPVVLMEALALEVPVVASRVAGIPELLSDDAGGLMFDPGNWVDLQEKLERLISNTTDRGQCARQGRARISRDFDIRKAVEPLIGLLRNV